MTDKPKPKKSKKKPERDPLDRYYTYPWITRGLLEILESEKMSIPKDAVILEPCAGDNGITSVLRENGYTVVTGDVDPAAVRRCNHDYEWDFPVAAQADLKDIFSPSVPAVGAVVTNPPFLIKGRYSAIDFVKAALHVAPIVAMLLRVTWLEPCTDRDHLFQSSPPALVVVGPRGSFVTPGERRRGSGEQATCCWFVWLRWQSTYVTRLRWVSRMDVPRLCGQQSLEV